MVGRLVFVMHVRIGRRAQRMAIVAARDGAGWCKPGSAPIQQSLDELFMERYDAILTPSALGTAPKGLSATGDPLFCVPWTLFGLPATLATLTDRTAVHWIRLSHYEAVEPSPPGRV